MADSLLVSLCRLVARNLGRGNDDAEQVMVARTCGPGAGAAVGEGLTTARKRGPAGPARGWKQMRSTLQGGKRRDDHHELSILIRLGDWDRAGRARSNVSTMIIRPPQHGQRRKDEAGSASASAGALSGETLDAASKSRARSMLEQFGLVRLSWLGHDVPWTKA